MDEIADDDAGNDGKLVDGPLERKPLQGRLIQPSREGG